MSLRVLHQKRGRRRRKEGGKWLSAEWPVFYNSGERRITLVALLNRWFASTCGKNQQLPCVRGLKGHRKGLKRHKTKPLSGSGRRKKMSSYSLIAPLTLLSIPSFSMLFCIFFPPSPLFFRFLSSSMRIFFRDEIEQS